MSRTRAKCPMVSYDSGKTFVAQVLQRAGLGTLLIDLLSQEEDVAYEARFDIHLLAERLTAATQWLRVQPLTKALGIGYFGASTGAAAALQAAAALGPVIRAVVSRAGVPIWPGPPWNVYRRRRCSSSAGGTTSSSN